MLYGGGVCDYTYSSIVNLHFNRAEKDIVLLNGKADVPKTIEFHGFVNRSG